MNHVRVLNRSALIGVVLIAMLRGETLPVRPLTIAQGLAGNAIHKIVRDSRGFMWFCTGDGLSRFDGYEFVNYGTSNGFPGRVAWDFTETRSGSYWVATNGGLVRLPSGQDRRMEVLLPGDDARSRTVLALKETRDGTLWVGTENGLYRLQKHLPKLARVDTGPPPETWSQPTVAVLEEDGDGNLWFGGYSGIGRITTNGKLDRWTPRQGFASYVVPSLLRDADGSIWAGTEEGLCHMLAHPQPGARPVERCYGRADGLPSPYIQSVLRTSDGRLWTGTLEGAAYALPGAGPMIFSAVTARQGLSDDNIEALAEDLAGNLWLGTADDGAMTLSHEGFTLFTEADGLVMPNVVSLFEDREGHLYAVTRSASNVVLHIFDGVRFHGTAPAVPENVRAFGRGFQQVALQDRFSEWWIATGDGLLRYGPGGIGALRTRPKPYVRSDVRDGANVFRLYEDSHGAVWWSTSARAGNTLNRLDPARARIERFADAEGLPPLASSLPSAFVEDSTGDLWVGFDGQGLARYRRNGGFEYLDPSSGYPGGRIRSSYRDRKGRLWFGSSTGLWSLDNPQAAKPVFRHFTPSEGLSSFTVYSITDDAQGRIYVGTGSGLDRLNPESGRIDHFSSSHGLPTGLIQAAYTDRQGTLWFATRHGIARLIPRSVSRPGTEAAVRITSVKVRGIEQPVSVAGETDMTGLTFHAGQDQVEFGFTGGGFRDTDGLLYQYRLEGVRSADWSAAAGARSVNFASLPPGSYRFTVRAASFSYPGNTVPATVAFRILPPFWQTWWFRVCMIVLCTAIVYGLYRYRMSMALEREHLRMRIATDLHDDIGSSLSSIAIWTEVAAQQAKREDGRLVQPLEQIGTVSREVIDSVSDIVWAINPRHDHFTDLASRLRSHAGDVAAGANLPISFTVQGEGREAAVAPAVRREVFLVFKEALSNALRHSGCSRCSAALFIESGWINLQIIDDGRGFDARSNGEGNGLDSMHRRAARMGGTLRVDSASGSGTKVELRVPASGTHNRGWTRYLHT